MFEYIIPETTYSPIPDETQLEIQYELFLEKLQHIEEPFEKVFFILVFFPYLQPFSEGNMELSRMLANIPLMTHGFAPVSFYGVDEKQYHFAYKALYELFDMSYLENMFLENYFSCEEGYL